MAEDIIMEEFDECAETETFCVQLVYEFLVCYNFRKTVEAFVEEIQSCNYPLPENLPLRKNRIERRDAFQMVSSLNSGDHLQFFKSWTDLIPKSIKCEREYENITVLLHSYFATLPMRGVESRVSKTPEDKEQSDRKNEEISESTKLIYAESAELGLIPEESTGEEIVSESSELKQTESTPDAVVVEEVSTENLGDENEVRIQTAEVEDEKGDEEETQDLPSAMVMFKNYLLENKYRFSSETEYLPLFALPFIENPKEHQAYSEVFQDKWVIDLKSTLKAFLVKYSCGDSVVPRLVSLCRENKKLAAMAKKFDANFEESTKNYHETKSKLHKLKRDHKQLVGVATELATALENSVRGQAVDLNNTLLRCASIFPDVFPETYTSCNEGLKERLDKQKTQFCPLQLDLKRIKEDLTTSSMKTKLLILQALRWYLCGLPCDERSELVRRLRAEDALGLEGLDGLTRQWLASPAHPLQQALARWLNLLCSIRSGRSYVAGCVPSLVPAIVKAACRPEQDPLTRDMLLATLQKLSLRKELCEVMVQEGLLDWLGLQMSTMTADYRAQYSTSLFVNLSLVAPESFWDTRPHQVLPGLIALLKSSNIQVRQFVCGSLYCLLRSDKVNIFARSVNLSGELAGLSGGPLRRQVEALVKLHQRAHPPTQISCHPCPERELDDPEEIEPEINNNDLVKGTPSGDELLFQKYSVVFTAPCVVDREEERQKARSKMDLPTWAQ